MVTVFDGIWHDCRSLVAEMPKKCVCARCTLASENCMKLLIGIVLAFVIGAACRVFDIPAPAPPMLTGALLVCAMTGGYMAGDKFMKQRQPQPAPIVAPAAPAEQGRQTDSGRN
jgi:XapX domain-containing protein